MTDRVVIGYCHPFEVPAPFMESMLSLVVFDMNGPHRLANGGGWIDRYSSANITQARNGIVETFLDDTQAEWLLMVDADMTFPPDIIERLLGAADEDTAPVVGALCFGTDDGTLFPTLYQMVTDESGPRFVRFRDWPEDTLFQVTATGAACLLVHRKVLVAMREKHPAPYSWFQETQLGDVAMGEDMTFCARAGLLGFPIYVHTGIEAGHCKAHILTADLYRAQRALEADRGARDAG